jgi:hypothetical protein
MWRARVCLFERKDLCFIISPFGAFDVKEKLEVSGRRRRALEVLLYVQRIEPIFKFDFFRFKAHKLVLIHCHAAHDVNLRISI